MTYRYAQISIAVAGPLLVCALASGASMAVLIAKNIVTVAEAAKAASAGASDTLASAKELSRLAADLQQVSRRFTM
jgi:hypothetical protein